MCLNGKNCYKVILSVQRATNDNINRIFMFLKCLRLCDNQISREACLGRLYKLTSRMKPCPGFIYMTINFKVFSLKPPGKSQPNFTLSLLGKGAKNLNKWSRSHDEDIRHAHIW